MPYLTELHCHTGEVSDCAGASAEFIVSEYIKAGYSSLTVTNHLSRFTFNGRNKKYSGNDSWEDKIDFFMNGIEVARRVADRRINILWGVELRLNTDNNDYLVHGVDEAFLRSNPDILDINLKELGSRIHAVGGLIFQAHPFRDYMKVVRPEYLDGVETFNGHIKHDSRNDISLMWAKKFGLRELSGTDFHDISQVPIGGILTDLPITNSTELIEVLKSNTYTPLHRGEDPSILLQN